MSKKARIQRLRAERIAAERAQAARELRARRLRRLGAIVLSAAVMVAGAAVVSAAQDQRTAPPAGETSSLLAGLTERAGVLGDPKAPLTVTEYLDFQCPVCAVAARETLPVILRDYVRTGKVRLEARALHFLGEDSVKAARVAAGAERQRRLWPFIEAFYARQGTENSGYVTDDFLGEVAGVAGVDLDRALDQADSAFATARLDRANADGERLGVQGTPTFSVRRGDEPERVLEADPLSPDAVAAALDRELAR
jgi:protein-disulfide isomerase